MSTKKILVLLLVLTMVMVNFMGGTVANAESTTGTYVEIVDQDATVWELTPGTTKSILIPIRSVSTYIDNPRITVDAGEAPFTLSTPKLTTNELPLGAYAIMLDGKTYINMDITVKENAKIGKYPINIDISFDTADLETGEAIPLSQTLIITAKVTKEKAPAQLTISNIKYNEDAAAIGGTFDVTFDVKNEGEISALNTYMTMDYNATGIIAGYTTDNIKIGDLNPQESKSVTLSMKVLTTAIDGLKNLFVNFSYKDSEGESGASQKDMYLTIKKISTAASEEAKLIVSSYSTNNQVNAGESYSLKGIIKNLGKKKATNVEVSIISGIGVDSGIIPEYEAQALSLLDVAAGKGTDFILPLLVTEAAPAGLTELTVQVSYTDSQGNARTTVTSFYMTINKKEQTTENSDLVISNVSQSPEKPMVGQKLTISFEVENRGNKAASRVSIGGEGLTTSGFEPFTAQPYKEIGTIEAGQKKKVSVDFMVGAGVNEGLNLLTLGCKYEDLAGNKQTVTTDIYVLNVVNDSNSKPKIIVSNFSKDEEELKAGSTFNFTYTLKNTHTSKAAKNIKVSLVQQDNVFSATQGTNTFYIDRIGADEEVENTINLKVKSDVTTAAYELEIKVEYEYDDMSKVDQEAGGVTEDNRLKLQVIENLRPSIQNIDAGNYGELPYVNESSTLSFDFINMGKSSLNNVRFSLEGDFILESGESYYFGTMAPGNPEFVELMVTPTMSGMCGGTIIMTFEDSNGDEVVSRQNFSNIMVMEPMNPDSFGDGMLYPDFPAFNEDNQSSAKKDIIPVWLFILIQVAILAIMTPVVRVIGIKCYKKKLRNLDGDE